MKKLLVIFIAFLSILVLTTSPKAQIHLSLGPELGVALPLSDYSGEVTDYYNGTKYGMKTGFNFGATLKAELIVLSGRLDISYSMHENEGNPTGQNNSSLTTKMNNLIIGFGPEYQIDIPMSPVKPYGSIEFLISTFGGEFQFQGTSSVNSSNNKMTTATRTGIGIILGTEIKLAVFALDINLRYNMLNAFGQSFTSYNNNPNNR